MTLRSPEDQAAVDAQRLAGDRLGTIGAEERDRAGDVFGLSGRGERLSADDGSNSTRGRRRAAGVRVRPGATALTVIPSRPSARRAYASGR